MFLPDYLLLYLIRALFGTLPPNFTAFASTCRLPRKQIRPTYSQFIAEAQHVQSC